MRAVGRTGLELLLNKSKSKSTSLPQLPCVTSAAAEVVRSFATADSDASATHIARQAAALNDEIHAFFGIEDDGSDPLSSTSTPTAQSSSSRNCSTTSSVPISAASDHQNPAAAPRLTHTDDAGKAAMVDVGHKAASSRSATAAASVLLGPSAFALVAANKLAKGDVLNAAQLAGIMGAKHTSTLIPLCHPLLLSHVNVTLKLSEPRHAVEVQATASTVGPTGVEMEALTAVAVAALTVYDMCKAASKTIEITGVKLLRKEGGKSGLWVRGDDQSV